MADKGIIFSAPMVRALLDGRKTQTRRLVKPVMREGVNPNFSGLTAHRWGGNGLWMLHGSEEASAPFKVPYAPGDRLYVRESWRTLQKWDDLKPRHLADDIDKIDYAADGYPRNPLWAWGKGRPSIFMPRWASRLTLLVTDVRVQRVAEISDDDAVAEGITADYLEHIHGPDGFRDLWNSLHTKPGEAWADNPWVVAVTFAVQRANIDTNSNGEGGSA